MPSRIHLQAACYEDHSIPHSLKAHFLFDLPVIGFCFLMLFTLAQQFFAVNCFYGGVDERSFLYEGIDGVALREKYAYNST